MQQLRLAQRGSMVHSLIPSPELLGYSLDQGRETASVLFANHGFPCDDDSSLQPDVAAARSGLPNYPTTTGLEQFQQDVTSQRLGLADVGKMGQVVGFGNQQEDVVDRNGEGEEDKKESLVEFDSEDSSTWFVNNCSSTVVPGESQAANLTPVKTAVTSGENPARNRVKRKRTSHSRRRNKVIDSEGDTGMESHTESEEVQGNTTTDNKNRNMMPNIGSVGSHHVEPLIKGSSDHLEHRSEKQSEKPSHNCTNGNVVHRSVSESAHSETKEQQTSGTSAARPSEIRNKPSSKITRYRIPKLSNKKVDVVDAGGGASADKAVTGVDGSERLGNLLSSAQASSVDNKYSSRQDKPKKRKTSKSRVLLHSRSLTETEYTGERPGSARCRAFSLTPEVPRKSQGEISGFKSLTTHIDSSLLPSSDCSVDNAGHSEATTTICTSVHGSANNAEELKRSHNNIQVITGSGITAGDSYDDFVASGLSESTPVSECVSLTPTNVFSESAHTTPRGVVETSCSVNNGVTASCSPFKESKTSYTEFDTQNFDDLTPVNESGDSFAVACNETPTCTLLGQSPYASEVTQEELDLHRPASTASSMSTSFSSVRTECKSRCSDFSSRTEDSCLFGSELLVERRRHARCLIEGSPVSSCDDRSCKSDYESNVGFVAPVAGFAREWQLSGGEESLGDGGEYQDMETLPPFRPEEKKRSPQDSRLRQHREDGKELHDCVSSHRMQSTDHTLAASTPQSDASSPSSQHNHHQHHHVPTDRSECTSTCTSVPQRRVSTNSLQVERCASTGTSQTERHASNTKSQSEGCGSTSKSQSERRDSMSKSQSEGHGSMSKSQSERRSSMSKSQSERRGSMSKSQSDRCALTYTSQPERHGKTQSERHGSTSGKSQSESCALTSKSQSVRHGSNGTSQPERHVSTDTSPSEGRGSTGMSPSKGCGSTGISPSEGRGSTGISPSEGHGSTGTSPSERRGSTGTSPSERRGSTGISPSEEHGSTGTSPSERRGPTSTSPSERRGPTGTFEPERCMATTSMSQSEHTKSKSHDANSSHFDHQSPSSSLHNEDLSKSVCSHSRLLREIPNSQSYSMKDESFSNHKSHSKHESNSRHKSISSLRYHTNSSIKEHVSNSSHKHESRSSHKHESSSSQKHESSSSHKHESSSSQKHESSSSHKHESSSSHKHESRASHKHESSSSHKHESRSRLKVQSSSSVGHEPSHKLKESNSTTRRESSSTGLESSFTIRHESSSTIRCESSSKQTHRSHSKLEHKTCSKSVQESNSTLKLRCDSKIQNRTSPTSKHSSHSRDHKPSSRSHHGDTSSGLRQQDGDRSRKESNRHNSKHNKESTSRHSRYRDSSPKSHQRRHYRKKSTTPDRRREDMSSSHRRTSHLHHRSHHHCSSSPSSHVHKRTYQRDEHMLLDFEGSLSPPPSKRFREDGVQPYSKYRHSTPSSVVEYNSVAGGCGILRPRCDDESSVITLGSLDDPVILGDLDGHEEDHSMDMLKADAAQQINNESLESGELISFDSSRIENDNLEISGELESGELESGELESDELESDEVNNFDSSQLNATDCKDTRLSHVSLNVSNNCNSNYQKDMFFTKVLESTPKKPLAAPPLTPIAPPLSPLAPPLSPLAPPLTPIAPPLSPLAPPLSPLAPPLTPLAAPLTPLAAPLTPLAPPLSPLAPPLSPLAPPKKKKKTKKTKKKKIKKKNKKKKQKTNKNKKGGGGGGVVGWGGGGDGGGGGGGPLAPP